MNTVQKILAGGGAAAGIGLVGYFNVNAFSPVHEVDTHNQRIEQCAAKLGTAALPPDCIVYEQTFSPEEIGDTHQTVKYTDLDRQRFVNQFKWDKSVDSQIEKSSRKLVIGVDIVALGGIALGYQVYRGRRPAKPQSEKQQLKIEFKNMKRQKLTEFNDDLFDFLSDHTGRYDNM